MDMNLYAYFNGFSIAMYFAVCLLCGLQLVGHIFSYNRYGNSIVSRLLGGVLLAWAGGALLYMGSALTHIDGLAMAGGVIDVAAFAGLACLAYVLYANQWPTFRTALILSLPYGLIILFAAVYPHLYNEAFIVVMACLLAQYLYYFRALHRREQLLNDLYADPERHSLKWLKSFACMYVAYWAVRLCFVYTSLSPWSDAALFICMTVLILFVFAKVCNYGESVSLETQQQVEEVYTHTETPVHKGTNLQPARLKTLMEQEQLYLNPDLTVEDVVRRLGTNTKYFSNVLHHEMHTTFSQWVNEYRIERAKQLLQNKDEKVVNLAWQCGFNSNQSFYRTFAKYTGLTPTQWREK